MKKILREIWAGIQLLAIIVGVLAFVGLMFFLDKVRFTF